MVKHRALAAAFNGAHHFGVEVFEPATASTLLAALLVRDLNTAPAQRAHPWQDEAYAAVHGGLWRAGYAPRSVLGFALAARRAAPDAPLLAPASEVRGGSGARTSDARP